MKLKFRAWDNKNQYMAYQGTADLETIQSFFHHYGDQTLMQWTGLNDKNGKEIYEGDLIKTPDNRTLPVIFKEGCFGFENSFENIFEIKKFTYFTKALADTIEVIDNIYEIEEIPMFRGTKKELEDLF